MRAFWVFLHRYVGPAIAAFVTIAGLTGSLLAYWGPLNRALVTDPFSATATGTPLGLAALDVRVETLDRALRIVQWPLSLEQGKAAAFSVTGGIDPSTGKAASLGYDTVYLDPVSGDVVGTSAGNDHAPPAGKVLDFVYSLHYTLALPGERGKQWGIWIMGVAALLWFVDCFVGGWLTLPRQWPVWPRWKIAWQVKPRRLNFDLHRAGGLWCFGMLAILALSSVQQNLNHEVLMPIARLTLPLAPDPFAGRPERQPPLPPATQLQPATAAQLAIEEARRRGWHDLPERLQRDDAAGTYRAIFTTPASEWLTSTRRELFLDDVTGRVIHAYEPGHGRVGDSMLDWLSALHFGTVLGWPYKLLLCVTGLAIAMLSITGVLIWWRKRAARHGRFGRDTARRSRQKPAPGPHAAGGGRRP